MVWMTPLGQLSASLAVALILLVVAAGKRAGVRASTGWFTLCFFSGWSALLTYYPRLSQPALLLLAAGLATVAVRAVERRPDAARAWARRGSAALALVMVATFGGLAAYRTAAERLAVGALPAPHRGAPSILLIILDTVRAQSLSLFGHAEPTSPQLARLAAGGTRFDLAASTAPWTTPSHATMFTSRYLPQHGADWRSDMADSLPTLAEVLAAHGYRTGGFSANKVHAGRSFGFARGFHHFEDYMVSPGELANSTSLGRFVMGNRRLRRFVDTQQLPGRKSADDVNASLLHWVDRGADRPFFAFVNYYDAHFPYLPPEPFATAFGASRTPPSLRLRLYRFLRPTAWPRPSEKAYDASIAYLDDRLGRLFDELAGRGILDHTLVIVTADHGEEFGEHGLWGHGDNLYLPNLHVPLVLRLPGAVPAAGAIGAPVSLRDIPATIMDLAGLADESPFQGHSLAALWRSDAAPRVSAPLSEVSGLPDKPARSAISRGDMVSVVSDSLHLIRNGDGIEELYDVITDPSAGHDLWAQTGHEVRNGLHRLLDSLSAARRGGTASE